MIGSQILVFALLFPFSSLVQSFYGGIEPVSMDQLNNIAVGVELYLKNFLQRHTYLEMLTERDERLLNEETDVENLITLSADKIRRLLEDRKDSLLGAVERLEAATLTYKFQDELEYDPTNVVYLNVSTGSDAEKITPVDHHFGAAINPNMTGIHVPIEIYRGSPEIVNGLQWSSALDPIFASTYATDHTISWQYFASQTGFARIYPAPLSWPIPPPYENVDLFDARRRSWYIQGANSPKDVIILMDRSGSVHGQTFSIMKFAVEVLLDTLGEDDFVNIASFNDTTLWVDQIVNNDLKQCTDPLEPLLPSTTIFKKALSNNIKMLTDKGMANYSAALTFAYETFKKHSEEGKRAPNCHQLIMVFSDGGTEWPEGIFKKFTNDTATMSIRVFTYAVGPHPIPTAVLKQMSCETGGDHTVIMSNSAVRTRIQDSYLGTITKPLAKSGSHQVAYSSTYTSAITSVLTLSMSLPVFNKTNQKKPESSEFLGVVGTDIPIHQLINLCYLTVLGPMNYPFLLNERGIAIFHPRLFEQMSYYEYPPQLDFDIVDVNEVSEVRKQMIKRERGALEFDGHLFLDEDHYVSEKVKYTFTPVANTPFSLGILTMPRSFHLKVSSTFEVSQLDLEHALLAPLYICGSYPAPVNPKQIADIIQKDRRRCDEHLLKGLFWADQWSVGMIDRWRKSLVQPEHKIISKAIFTVFGLAKVLSSGPISVYGERLGAEWRAPWKNVPLKRAISSPSSLSITVHHDGAFISLPRLVNGEVVAVVGVNVTSSLLKAALDDSVSKSSMFGSILLLVDDGAHIISSTKPQGFNGEFLGKRWPLLFEKLLDAGIFHAVNITQAQSLCKISRRRPIFDINIGSRAMFFNPLRHFVQILIKIGMAIKYFHTWLYGFTSLLPEPTEAFYKPTVEGFETCILRKSVYRLTGKLDFSGNISCHGNPTQILVKRLPTANAIAISVEQRVVDLGCEGWRRTQHREVTGYVSLGPRFKVIDPRSLICSMTTERNGPRQCFTEIPQKCGADVVTEKVLFIILAFFILDHLRCA